MRLWGQHGQDGLQASNICVLHASATSAEVLKNLVLPGIGSFTIVDNAKVEAADLGNNFFVDLDSLGKSRAATVTAQLLEMNPFVEGHALEESPSTLIDERMEFFSSFTMVVADALSEPQLVKLAEYLWKANIPLVITRSYGFIGYIRLAVPEHGMVETHPPDVPDLRIQDPWPEMDAYMNSVDLAVDDMKAHSHIPWLVLVYRYFHQYRKDNNGQDPPRREFSKYLKDQRLKNANGNFEVEENFDEAARNGWRAFSKYSIPSAVKRVMDDAATALNEKSSKFWVLIAALKQFVANEGAGKYLPVAGGIPDMHASTDHFIAVQRVYQQKADKDVDAVMAHVQALQSSAGTKHEIAREEVKRFCKNSRNIRLIRYQSYADPINAEDISELINDEDQPEGKNIMWYILMRAVGNFQAKHSRYPGEADSDVAGDIPLLRTEVDAMLQSFNIKLGEQLVGQVDEYVQEAVRYGACELHNIAAFLGGVASLEIIKLATKQWVPLNNTFIFNGINGSGIAFEA